jgi:hypothetical protein
MLLVLDGVDDIIGFDRQHAFHSMELQACCHLPTMKEQQ